MRNSDIIKIITLSAALALAPGTAAEPIIVPELHEMMNPQKKAIPDIRSYEFNTSTYEVDFEMDDGKELSFEIAGIERFLLMDKLKIADEQIRNEYLTTIFNDVIPQMTAHKFSSALKNGNLWGVVEKVRQYADDPSMVLALMITESGLKKGYPATGECYGSLQIKRSLFDHVKKYFKGTKYHEKITGIKWKDVKQNDIKSQIRIAEAYLHLIKTEIGKHKKIKNPEEMQLWTCAAYNLGITAVSDFIKDYKGAELRWGDAKSELCSRKYIRKKLPQLKKRRLDVWKRSVTWSYVNASKDYRNQALAHYQPRIAHRPRDSLRGD